ncbi:alpha/beta fold hydrolase [Nocardia sp. NPDC052566]|uniref:alpha/beta fold hydrolase n=1 Tax=Nocardia sp. NPDC052566 TaxID=3364330 RepID=UPI0037C634EA
MTTGHGGRIGRVSLHGYHWEYTDFGSGDRVVVLLHGLLFHRGMDERLAVALCEHGFRVLSIDQLGHGGSARPVDPRAYSVQQFAGYVLAILDELGIDQAIVAGRSLGANTALELALLAPHRVRGLITEGPILEGAQPVAMAAFGPFLVAGVFAAPVLRLIAAGAARMPRGRNLIRDIVLDALGGDPKARAALLRGIMFGRTAPPSTERAAIEAETLVIGYPKDPLHRDSEVRTLLAELPAARYLRLASMYELHTGPHRVLDEVVAFLHRCWGADA